MPKEILLYSDIYGWTAERAITDLNDARSQSEVVIRFNGDGGEVRSGWAIIGKAKELKGKKLFKNDGEANSMMAFAFCYNDNNKAYDTSSFKFHRASFGLNYEASEYFTADEQKELADKNAKLRAAFESKIDQAKLKERKNITADELFAMPGQAEVCLSAEDALYVGLINEIIPITPEYKAQVMALSQHFSPLKIAAMAEPAAQPPVKMTKEQIKAQFPDAYKEIFQAGRDKEFDRGSACLAVIDVDKTGAIEAFNSRKPLSEAQKMDFVLKAVSAKQAAIIENESAESNPVAAANSAQPVATAKTADEKEKLKLQAALKEQFKAMFPNSKKAA